MYFNPAVLHRTVWWLVNHKLDRILKKPVVPDWSNEVLSWSLHKNKHKNETPSAAQLGFNWTSPEYKSKALLPSQHALYTNLMLVPVSSCWGARITQSVQRLGYRLDNWQTVAHFLPGQEIFLISRISRLALGSTKLVEYEGLVLQGYSGQDMELTTHLHWMSRLRMTRDNLHSPYPCMVYTEGVSLQPQLKSIWLSPWKANHLRKAVSVVYGTGIFITTLT